MLVFFYHFYDNTIFMFQILFFSVLDIGFMTILRFGVNKGINLLHTHQIQYLDRVTYTSNVIINNKMETVVRKVNRFQVYYLACLYFHSEPLIFYPARGRVVTFFTVRRRAVPFVARPYGLRQLFTLYLLFFALCFNYGPSTYAITSSFVPQC